MRANNNFLKILTFLSLNLDPIRGMVTAANTNITTLSTTVENNEVSSKSGNSLIRGGLIVILLGLGMISKSISDAHRPEAQGLEQRTCASGLCGALFTVGGGCMIAFGYMYNNPNIDFSTISP